jgi:hypothetical protein
LLETLKLSLERDSGDRRDRRDRQGETDRERQETLERDSPVDLSVVEHMWSK